MLDTTKNNLKSAIRTGLIGSVMVGGLLTTIASVAGSYNYMMQTDGGGNEWLAGGFAFGLGLAIYLGWEFAFNAKKMSQRAAAALIAISAAMVSGYTLYQNAELPTITAAQAREQAATADAREAARQAAANQALVAGQLSAQLDQLRSQNAADLKTSQTIQAEIDAGAAPKANSKKLDGIKKGMESRNKQIGQLLDKLAVPVPTPTAPVSAGVGDVGEQGMAIDWPKLVRASMFEIMTVIFLLFASWMRDERKQEELAEAAGIKQAQAALDEALARLHTAIGTTDTAAAAHADAIRAAGAHATQQAQAALDEATRATVQAQEATRIATEQTDHAKAATSATREAVECAAGIRAKLEKASSALDTGIHHADQACAELLITIQQAKGQTTAIADATGEAESAHATLKKTLVDVTKAAATAVNAQPNIQGNVQTHRETYTHGNAQGNVQTHRETYTPENVRFQPAEVYVSMENEKLTEAAILNLLEMQSIATNDENYITVPHLMQRTELGRRGAERILQTAYEHGHLDRKRYGKGWIYLYPEQPAYKNAAVAAKNTTSNIFPINQPRSA